MKKGYIHSEEAKRKISLGMKGKRNSLGKVPWNKGLTKDKDIRIANYGKNSGIKRKGIKLSKEHIEKLSIIRKINPPKSIFKKGSKPWNKGLGKEKKKTLKSQGLKFIPKSIFKKGSKPWNFIDGRSKNKTPDRYGDDWNDIRQLIYYRDNYSCRNCGKKMDSNNILHIHHKIPFLTSFDNSFNNLITLCASCHRKEDAKIIKQNINGV